MKHRVGTAAHGHIHNKSVVERRLGQDIGGANILLQAGFQCGRGGLGQINPLRVQFGYELGSGLLGPYGIKGNSPDFADVSTETGPVKYELVNLRDVTLEHDVENYVGGNPFFTENEDEVVAKVLVEMIDDMTIRVEVFVGKTADEVTGFTEAALIYVR